MIRATNPIDTRPNIRQRVGEIQAQWSSNQRDRRAREGARRRQEFLAMISARFEEKVEPAVWAVGSVCDDDLRRLAS